MLKKLLLMLLSFGLAVSAWAVDVNKANQAELDSVKGIGPAISKRIVDERSKNGAFKDWADFEKRVKGVGDKSAAKMSEAGLTVNGKAMEGAAAKKSSDDKKSADKKPESSASKSSSADKASSKPGMDKAESRPSASGASTSKSGSDKKENAK